MSPRDPSGRLARILESSGFSALVVIADSSRDSDLAPFVGPVHLGQAVLVAPKSRRPLLCYLTSMEREEAAASGCTLLAPESIDLSRLRRESGSSGSFWAALLEKALIAAGVSPSTVALAGKPPVGLIHSACCELESKGWKFGDGNRVARLFRKSKSQDQIDEVRRTAGVVCAAFRSVAELLSAASIRGDELWLEGERLMVERLRSEVATQFANAGLEQPTGNIFAVGARSAIPHTQGEATDHLKLGKTFVMDLFPRETLFADCTRTFCMGATDERVLAAHEEVCRALAKAQELVRIGTKARALQAAVCSRFEESGYQTPRSTDDPQHGYVHNLGHGVGFELHEYPTFADIDSEEGRFEAGDLFTLEPGLYEPSLGYGVRLENLYHLTDDSLELLTDLPYDMDPKLWA